MTQTFYLDPTQGVNGTGTSVSPFNTMANAAAGMITAFNSATEDYVLNCRPGLSAGSGFFDINTTSATPRKFTIQVENAAARHTASRGTGFRQGSTLQIHSTNANVTVEVIGIAVAGQRLELAQINMIALVKDCLFYDSADVGMYIAGGIVNVVNCGAMGATTDGFFQENGFGSPTVKYINCTSVGNGGYGFNRGGGAVTPLLKNCYSGGNGTNAYNGTSTKTNCMHSGASVFTGSTANTAYSTANLNNVTAGSQVLYLPSGSALLGAGIGPGSDADIPLTDFDGQTRAGATTDVGMDQRTSDGAVGQPRGARGAGVPGMSLVGGAFGRGW